MFSIFYFEPCYMKWKLKQTKLASRVEYCFTVYLLILRNMILRNIVQACYFWILKKSMIYLTIVILYYLTINIKKILILCFWE